MRKSRLILNELEQSLQFWDDLFLILRLQEKAEKLKYTQLESAISAFNIPADLRTIVRPGEFRTQLYGKSEIDPKRFLPLAPVRERHWLNQLDYARTAPINAPSLIFFPYVTANWLKSKKVFQVDPGIIPLVNPKRTGIRDIFSRKNFLSLLPCDSFVIHFTEPLEIELESFPVIKSYKCCIVVRSGDLIDTFWVPSDLETKSLQREDREFIEKMIANKHIRDRELRRLRAMAERMSLADEIRLDKVEEGVFKVKVEPVCFTVMSFLVDKPYCFIMPSGSESKPTRIFRDVFAKTPMEYTESNGKFTQAGELKGSNEEEILRIKERVRFQKFFFEFINGFCYALSEIKPKTAEPIQNGKEGKSNDFSMRLSWNEVPITRIEYLSEDEEHEGTLKVSYGSGEKSAHVRRGHWRHLIKKDGTHEKIWIEQTIVRVDKLENGEDLKGAVTVLRAKRAPAQ